MQFNGVNEVFEPHASTKSLGDGFFEKNGEKFYDTRNYDPAQYTFNRMR